MNKKANIRTLNLIGFLFLIWGILAIVDNIIRSKTNIAPLLWLSYICLILISIGILRKNSALIASQIAIIFIPYILWNLDFFHQLITNDSLFGITDYFFQPGTISEKIVALQHIFNLPLSIYALHLTGLKERYFWGISLFQISILFPITRLFTSYDQNVNCVYHNCANFTFELPYTIEWFAAQTIMILLTSWFLTKTLYKKDKK